MHVQQHGKLHRNLPIAPNCRSHRGGHNGGQSNLTMVCFAGLSLDVCTATNGLEARISVGLAAANTLYPEVPCGQSSNIAHVMRPTERRAIAPWFIWATS